MALSPQSRFNSEAPITSWASHANGSRLYSTWNPSTTSHAPTYEPSNHSISSSPFTCASPTPSFTKPLPLLPSDEEDFMEFIPITSLVSQYESSTPSPLSELSACSEMHGSGSSLFSYSPAHTNEISARSMHLGPIPLPLMSPSDHESTYACDNNGGGIIVSPSECIANVTSPTEPTYTVDPFSKDGVDSHYSGEGHRSFIPVIPCGLVAETKSHRNLLGLDIGMCDDERDIQTCEIVKPIPRRPREDLSFLAIMQLEKQAESMSLNGSNNGQEMNRITRTCRALYALDCGGIVNSVGDGAVHV